MLVVLVNGVYKDNIIRIKLDIVSYCTRSIAKLPVPTFLPYECYTNEIC